jgi:hypothetical protein
MQDILAGGIGFGTIDQIKRLIEDRSADIKNSVSNSQVA